MPHPTVNTKDTECSPDTHSNDARARAGGSSCRTGRGSPSGFGKWDLAGGVFPREQTNPHRQDLYPTLQPAVKLLDSRQEDINWGQGAWASFLLEEVKQEMKECILKEGTLKVPQP